jgi:protein phosphatase
MREQELSQITKDQTVAQNLLDRGTFTAEDLERSPFNNVLSSAVGMDPTPVASIVELRKGDTLLLCSDGLTKHVGTQRIAEHLLASKSAEDACQRLLDTALQGGGSDNITMIVSRFGEARIAAFRGNPRQSRQEPLQLDRPLV